MPFGSVRLVPGVDTEKTPTLNTTGIATGNLIRWREGLVEKIGGWVKWFASNIGSIVRDLHAWQDLNGNQYLAVGATASLSVITGGARTDITPQVTTTNTPPIFTFTNSSTRVSILDPNYSGPTTNSSVFLATPVWGCGIVLQGLYRIVANLSLDSYQIEAASAATSSTTSSVVTLSSTDPAVVSWMAHGLASGTPILFTTSGALPIGMTQYKTYFILAAGLSTDTFQFSDTPGGTPIDTSADGQTGVQTCTANMGCVPIFTSAADSGSINIQEDSHGLGVGQQVDFLVSTSVGGTTVSGAHIVQSVVDVDNYTISTSPTASAYDVQLMNGGNVRFVYYIAIGPQSQPKPYGAGPYGADAYGIGSSAPVVPGTPITATDWSTDNWGQILLACPQGGGIYQWVPGSGFTTGQLILNGPIVNASMFVAMPYQIVIALGSSFDGVVDPLQVNWCTIGDYTVWAPLSTNQAGGFRIPTGSKIVGGMQAPQQGLVWTDIDLYAMQYIGPPNVFGFSKIMGGCGLLGSHAMGQLGNTIYWMSAQQFFVMPSGGAPQQLPCTVWDYIFQNIDTANAWKVRCKPNSNFATIGWEFPSISGGTGENDSYVEYNVVEQEWTIGRYPVTGRSAWIDQSLLGPPIAGTPSGLIYQHEVGYNADGAAMNPTFTTGRFVIGEGEEFYFIDQFIPDFKYGTQGGSQTASIQITLNTYNFPNDTPVASGPYTVSQASNYVSTRLRGRQVSMTVQSGDLASFWRIGLIRFRFSSAGRR